MKRAVGISIGSSKRDKTVQVTLLGEEVSLERIGTDGDMEAAALKYRELDGRVDAFGVGGADLGLLVDNKWYPLYSVRPMIRYVKKTPIVDGVGLKNTLENKSAPYLEAHIADYLGKVGRRVFVVSGADRWGMSSSFLDAGYECAFGDLMFGLNIPVALRSARQLKNLAAVLMPIVGRLPFKWIYPTGGKQEQRRPRFQKYYAWASVIAGDCHYIKRHMPDDMQGKIILTNTTTPEDLKLFGELGVKFLVTTTPVLDGRSFGTNMMEAALVAISGKGRPLERSEYADMLGRLQLEPQLQELN